VKPSDRPLEPACSSHSRYPPASPALIFWLARCCPRARGPPQRSSRRLRFDVFVPAHDEEAVIARTVANLRRLDWPADRFRVIVIADNCSDATSSIATQAGAKVFERTNPELRGKGYALKFAFERSAAEAWADAVVVIDADAEASANLLEAFAARIERGACAVQAHYGVLNPLASWRTRLITIAKAAFTSYARALAKGSAFPAAFAATVGALPMRSWPKSRTARSR